MAMDDRAAREQVARVESLLEAVESLPDPDARETATELVGAVVELYGEGLERVLSLATGDHPIGLDQALVGDELVSHLLLLHGLHPVPVQLRVEGALDEVRPYLDSHGGNVELLDVADGVARVRLEGSCSGCPSSTMTLKLAIEEAIHKAAPEVESVEAEGVTEERPAPQLLQIEVGPAGGPGGEAEEVNGSWTELAAMPKLVPEHASRTEVSGQPLLLLEVDGTPYAYRPDCPGCGSSLDGASLEGAELECPGCGKRFDARRAGRCLDSPALHLEPIPLLAADDGAVRVALGTAAA
jgi:Fe-S cluster biogenesis protein NfuA/nitrite reductase/ring-hydroxylating ferredoxin subunit